MNIQTIFFENMDLLFARAEFFNDNPFSDNKNQKNISHKIAVAISGGADSTSLLILADQYAKQYNIPIIAYTVNHNLRENSLQEAVYVHNLAKDLGIEHKILHWEHEKIKFGHIEKKARDARYSLLRNAMLNDNANILLTAHTENDLVETFVLRKLWHSKETGLAGISSLSDFKCGIFLLRPFLNIRKNHLIDFLNTININWVHDPSNDDENFQRVKIRQRLISKPKFYELILSKIHYYAKKRKKIEEDIFHFLKNHSKFDHSLFLLEISKEQLLKYDYKLELLQIVTGIIGGMKTPVTVSNEIVALIANSKKFTLGRTVIDSKYDFIKIYRENKNIPTLNQNEGYLFDNRIYVKLMHKNANCISFLGKSGLEYLHKHKIIDNCKDSNVKASSPTVFDKDGKILSVHFCNYKLDFIEWSEIKFGRIFIPFSILKY